MSSLLTPTRRRGFEILDDIAVDDVVRKRSLDDVARSNVIFGGARAVLVELAHVLGEAGTRTLTVLDVGTGIGDIPARATEEARARDRERSATQLDRRCGDLVGVVSAALPSCEPARRCRLRAARLYAGGAEAARHCCHATDADHASPAGLSDDGVVGAGAERRMTATAPRRDGPYDLGPMPMQRRMRTVDEHLVRAPLHRIFELARDVEAWPELLRHYRWVRFRHRASDGGGIVEMAAWRPFGAARWPTWWSSEMSVSDAAPSVRYRHIAGITTGMDVEWSFAREGDATRVRIVHVWDGPRR